MSFSQNKNIKHISNLVIWVSLIVCFIYVFLLYNQSVVFFNRTPWDGTFQTLFPLRKMDNGEFPGKDFFYFHGNGIPYLLYPIYSFLKFFGVGEILSALHSTFIINTIALFLPIYLLVKKQYSKEIALISTVICLILFDFLPFVGAYFSPLFLGAPMGIRCLPHMIVAIAFLSLMKRLNIGELKSEIIVLLWFAFWASIGVYLGAEQGFYSAAAGAVAFGLYYWISSGQFLRAFTLSFAYLILFAIFLVLTSLLFFQSLDSIKAVKIIAEDQVWVFGVYPNSFFTSLDELFKFTNMSAVPSQIATILSTCYLLVLIYLLRIKVINTAVFCSFFILYFGGLLSWVSNVGYIGAHQTALMIRFLMLGLIPLFYILLKRYKLNEYS